MLNFQLFNSKTLCRRDIMDLNTSFPVWVVVGQYTFLMLSQCFAFLKDSCEYCQQKKKTKKAQEDAVRTCVIRASYSRNFKVASPPVFLIPEFFFFQQSQHHDKSGFFLELRYLEKIQRQFRGTCEENQSALPLIVCALPISDFLSAIDM